MFCFFLQIYHWQGADCSHQGDSTYTYIKRQPETPALVERLLDVILLFRLFVPKIHPQPRREATMSGKQRSPRHRPWSVYRANTFDLSAEMMGLALSGNLVTVTMVTLFTSWTVKLQDIGKELLFIFSFPSFQVAVKIQMSRCWSSVWVSPGLSVMWLNTAGELDY